MQEYNTRYAFKDIGANEATSFRNYVGFWPRERPNYVAEWKFAYDGEAQDNKWSAVAVKFNPEATQEEVLYFATKVHANEYQGQQDGYHLFWYDL